jgi:hypothetical protein
MQGAGAAPRDEIAVAGKRSPGKGKPLRGYWLAIAGIAVVVAVAVVAASLRMTEGAIDRAVAERRRRTAFSPTSSQCCASWR